MYHFFFNDTATTEIYTLSLHDALPICGAQGPQGSLCPWRELFPLLVRDHQGVQVVGGVQDPHYSPLAARIDRKSTRLNSSHANISYAVFCLKKKKNFSHPLYACAI